MNKGLVVMNTILWSIVAIILIVILVSTIAGRFWQRDRDHGWQSGSDTYEYTVTENVDSIAVNWISGDVTIMTHDLPYIRLEQHLSTTATDDTKMSAVVYGNKLKVSDERTRRWGFLWFGNMYSTSVTIYVPKKSFSLLTVNGVSSRINMDNVEADEVQVQTVSGRITLNNVTADKVRSEVTSGKVFLNGSFSDISSSSVSGSAEISTKIMPKRLSCNAVSGRTTLYIPENDGFTVRFSKVSGKLTSDFPFVSQGDREYIYGNGTVRFSVDVVSGDCSIYKKQW